jgi:3-oxoacyl-[acyl-carrier-protein] synthase-3
MNNQVTSKSRITAIGSYVPGKKLTNEDLEKLVETNDEWIVQRTGMRERRIAAPEEFTSHLCIEAIRNLQARYNTSVTDVDFIIVATSTPDFPFPSVAAQIQHTFQISQAGAMDLSAACAGFAYGLHLANGLISSGLHRKILVVGADALSKITDYTDRSTSILFGDAAGAVLVEQDDTHSSFIAARLGSEGEGGIHLYKSHLANKINDQDVNQNGYIVQNGREVYKWAVQTVPREIKAMLADAEVTIESIDWFIPHSANLRIIESICEKLNYPVEKALHSVEYFGNTSAASIPLSLDLAVQDGRVKSGDRMVLFGFGGGLVYAGLVIEW